VYEDTWFPHLVPVLALAGRHLDGFELSTAYVGVAQGFKNSGQIFRPEFGRWISVVSMAADLVASAVS